MRVEIKPNANIANKCVRYISIGIVMRKKRRRVHKNVALRRVGGPAAVPGSRHASTTRPPLSRRRASPPTEKSCLRASRCANAAAPCLRRIRVEGGQVLQRPVPLDVAICVPQLQAVISASRIKCSSGWDAWRPLYSQKEVHLETQAGHHPQISLHRLRPSALRNANQQQQWP